MNWIEVRRMAKGLDINSYRMKKPDMIRAIQYAEHNIPCFGSERVVDCGEDNCLWRSDCLATAPFQTGRIVA